jgi:8-amino-7-oxononanoate synthase
MRSLDEFATAKLESLGAKALRRTLATTAADEGCWVECDGRRLLSFASNDYLNLTTHPAIKAAAADALARYGLGAGASRLVTGNHPLYRELEDRLAQIKGVEAACVFGLPGQHRHYPGADRARRSRPRRRAGP